jgi:hypothetical protein
MDSAHGWTEAQIDKHEQNMLSILIKDSKAEKRDE